MKLYFYELIKQTLNDIKQTLCPFRFAEMNEMKKRKYMHNIETDVILIAKIYGITQTIGHQRK